MSNFELEFLGNINDDEELMDSYIKFKSIYDQDKNIILKIDNVLETLNNSKEFTQYNKKVVHSILNSILGTDAATFILHVIKNGLEDTEHYENDIITDFIFLYAKHNRKLVAIDSYIKNPNAYLGIEYVSDLEKSSTTLNIIRADLESLTLTFSPALLAKLTEVLLDRTIEIIRNSGKPLPSRIHDGLLYSFEQYINVSGDPNEPSEDE